MVTIWTDGACRGNPGPGGWAWAADDGSWSAGAEAQSTNQRMEIMAAYRAVLDHPGPVHVISDSTYVVNCFRDRWFDGWKKRGWKNSQKKPVANRDLWEPFIDLYVSRSDEVTFEWVKGHSGDVMNDVVDRLAVRASHQQVAESGDVVPDDLGDADEVRKGSAAVAAGGGGRDKRLPAGRLLGVFGVRPPELGGWDPNPVRDAARDRLTAIIDAKREVDADLHVVSGLRLGAEMLGADAAVAAGVPLVAVLPFPDADSKWSAAYRAEFARLREAATVEILLERKVPDSAAKVAASLRRRDGWLTRQLDEAIVVWDGVDRFTGQTLKKLQDRLGDDVWEELVTD